MNFNRLLAFYRTLPKKDKKRVLSFIVFQIFLNVIDIVAILILGYVTSIVLSLNSGNSLGEKTIKYLKIFDLEFASSSKIIATLGVLALIAFFIKSILSLVATKFFMNYLGEIAGIYSSDLIEKIFLENSDVSKEASSQQKIFTITRGIDYLFLFTLGPFLILLVDISMILLLFGIMLTVNPLVASFLLAMYFFTWRLLVRRLNVKSTELGKKNAKLNVLVNERLQDGFMLFKELRVTNQLGAVKRSVIDLRKELSQKTSEFNYLPYAVKYVIEASLVAGAAFLYALQFKLNGADVAISSLAFFLISILRMGPTFLRMQQGIVMLRGNMELSLPTLKLIQDLSHNNLEYETATSFIRESSEYNESNFVARLELKDIQYRPSQDSNFKFERFNLTIEPSQVVGIVGPSGGGKTTLLDLMLGLRLPQHGEVKISGRRPLDSLENWPGLVGYVPQTVGIFRGTLRENLTLWDTDKFEDTELIKILERCSLQNFLKNQDCLSRDLGEWGSQISSGEKQRIGLARALLRKPRLLILDEFTSSLDASTEEKILKITFEYAQENSCTIVMVAHRLHTVAQVERILYVEGGKLLAEGSFAEVRSKIRDFDTQVLLQGLSDRVIDERGF